MQDVTFKDGGGAIGLIVVTITMPVAGAAATRSVFLDDGSSGKRVFFASPSTAGCLLDDLWPVRRCCSSDLLCSWPIGLGRFCFLFYVSFRSRFASWCSLRRRHVGIRRFFCAVFRFCIVWFLLQEVLIGGGFVSDLVGSYILILVILELRLGPIVC